MKFLLDTNFLMIPGQFKIDVYDQLRRYGPADLYVSDLSVMELDKIAKGHTKDAPNAKLAILILKKEGVKIIPSGKVRHADDAIRRIARREGMVVCTADKALKTSLKKRGVRVISLRQKKYLGFA